MEKFQTSFSDEIKKEFLKISESFSIMKAEDYFYRNFSGIFTKRPVDSKAWFAEIVRHYEEVKALALGTGPVPKSILTPKYDFSKVLAGYRRSLGRSATGEKRGGSADREISRNFKRIFECEENPNKLAQNENRGHFRSNSKEIQILKDFDIDEFNKGLSIFMDVMETKLKKLDTKPLTLNQQCQAIDYKARQAEEEFKNITQNLEHKIALLKEDLKQQTCTFAKKHQLLAQLHHSKERKYLAEVSGLEEKCGKLFKELVQVKRVLRSPYLLTKSHSNNSKNLGANQKSKSGLKAVGKTNTSGKGVTIPGSTHTERNLSNGRKRTVVYNRHHPTERGQDKLSLINNSLLNSEREIAQTSLVILKRGNKNRKKSSFVSKKSTKILRSKRYRDNNQVYGIPRNDQKKLLNEKLTKSLTSFQIVGPSFFTSNNVKKKAELKLL